MGYSDLQPHCNKGYLSRRNLKEHWSGYSISSPLTMWLSKRQFLSYCLGEHHICSMHKEDQVSSMVLTKRGEIESASLLSKPLHLFITLRF